MWHLTVAHGSGLVTAAVSYWRVVGTMFLCNGEVVTADVVRCGSGPLWSVFMGGLCVVPAGLVHTSAVLRLLSIPYSQTKEHWQHIHPSKCTFSSVTQSCPTLCDPMNRSRPGLPVHHQLPELAQTHVHWVGNAIQPSHPLLSPSPPALNLSQHQGLFQWVSSSHQVTKVLELQLQHQSFQWIFRADFLWDGLGGSPCSPRTLKSLLQHHNSRASILWRPVFFIDAKFVILKWILNLPVTLEQIHTFQDKKEWWYIFTNQKPPRSPDLLGKSMTYENRSSKCSGFRPWVWAMGAGQNKQIIEKRNVKALVRTSQSYPISG